MKKELAKARIQSQIVNDVSRKMIQNIGQQFEVLFNLDPLAAVAVLEQLNEQINEEVAEKYINTLQEEIDKMSESIKTDEE